MVDIVDKQTRTRMMRCVKRRDTKPEMRVRAALHHLGVRYRVENRDLPGSPDIANRRRKWAVFVNGCFWHGHKNCAKTKGGVEMRVPEQNREFWTVKLEGNRQRDARKCRELRREGYRVVLIWECQLAKSEMLPRRLSVLEQVES